MAIALYSRLEPIFAQAHNGDVPVKMDLVANAVLSGVWKHTYVTDVEYHPTPNFRHVIGALEKVHVAYNHQSDRIVAHVHYGAEENYCWERFAKAKELCQIVLGGEKQLTSKFNPVKDLIRGLVAPYMRGLDMTEDADPIRVDNLGLVAACEVLFPMRDRHYFASHMNDPDARDALLKIIRAQHPLDAEEWDGAPPKTDLDPNAPMSDLIAFAYRIPRTYVDTLLVDDTAYGLWKWARNDNPTRFASLEPKKA